jgi:hypothetical protein
MHGTFADTPCVRGSCVSIGVFVMRYTEVEVGLYFEDWESVLVDCETQNSVDADNFSDVGIVDIIDPKSKEVYRG